jgi:hypothetical protein
MSTSLRRVLLAACALSVVALPTAGTTPAAANYPCDNGIYSGEFSGTEQQYICQSLNDTGQHDLGEWDTTSFNQNCSGTDPDGVGYDYENMEYSHWTSASAVSVSSMDIGGLDSSTYTNWSVSTDHYVRSMEMCSTDYDDTCPCDASDQILTAPTPTDWNNGQRRRRATVRAGTPKPTTPPATLPERNAVKAISHQGVTEVAVTCLAGEHLAHAEASVGLLDHARSSLPKVAVIESGEGAMARFDGSRLRAGERGRLHVDIVCGSAHRTSLHGRASTLSVGTDGADNLHAVGGANRIFGGRGGDTIHAGSADDTVYGGDGNDTLGAGGGSDVLIGGRGDDHLTGGHGRRDMLVGGPGRDRLSGGAGHDNIDARDGTGDDTVTCGGGYDVVMADRGDHVAGDCERVIRRPR